MNKWKKNFVEYTQLEDALNEGKVVNSMVLPAYGVQRSEYLKRMAEIKNEWAKKTAEEVVKIYIVGSNPHETMMKLKFTTSVDAEAMYKEFAKTCAFAMPAQGGCWGSNEISILEQAIYDYCSAADINDVGKPKWRFGEVGQYISDPKMLIKLVKVGIENVNGIELLAWDLRRKAWGQMFTQKSIVRYPILVIYNLSKEDAVKLDKKLFPSRPAIMVDSDLKSTENVPKKVKQQLRSFFPKKQLDLEAKVQDNTVKPETRGRKPKEHQEK